MTDMPATAVVYRGTRKCNAPGCIKRAFYLVGTQVRCHRHSTADARTDLPARSQVSPTVDIPEPENQGSGKRGTVCVGQQKMMRSPRIKDGCVAVFPNYRAALRTDGLGLPALSPMSLGPVKHGQPGLPDALCIENFHQFNKVFATEVDGNGNPLPIWYERRRQGYLDAQPRRHKLGSTKAEHMRNSGNGCCLYCIVVAPDGTEHRYSYVESRRFYCKFYEQLAKARPEFGRLVGLLDRGVNLQIFGFDGYDVTMPIRDHYLDASRPFGHELVLYTLLTHSPDQYPWNC